MLFCRIMLPFFIMKRGDIFAMAVDYRMLVWRFMRNDLVRKILSRRILDAAGLQRGRLPILEVIQQKDGCTQHEIAELLHVSPASIAVSLRRMERDGLLQRSTDETDQRCRRIRITDAGRATAQTCRAGFDALDKRMFSAFSQEEAETLGHLLDRMFDGVAGDEFRDLSPFTAYAYAQKERERLKKESEETDD